MKALSFFVTVDTPIGEFAERVWVEVPESLHESEVFDYVEEYLQDEKVEYTISW